MPNSYEKYGHILSKTNIYLSNCQFFFGNYHFPQDCVWCFGVVNRRIREGARVVIKVIRTLTYLEMKKQRNSPSWAQPYASHRPIVHPTQHPPSPHIPLWHSRVDNIQQPTNNLIQHLKSWTIQGANCHIHYPQILVHCQMEQHKRNSFQLVLSNPALH